MSVIGEIRVSLDAMGFEQQALLFVFIASYPLALGRLLDARGRRSAAGVAAASMAGFVLATAPWMHGVLVGVFLVGGLGGFIAAVCLLDRLLAVVLPAGPPVVAAPSEARCGAGAGRAVPPARGSARALGASPGFPVEPAP